VSNWPKTTTNNQQQQQLTKQLNFNFNFNFNFNLNFNSIWPTRNANCSSIWDTQNHFATVKRLKFQRPNAENLLFLHKCKSNIRAAKQIVVNQRQA